MNITERVVHHQYLDATTQRWCSHHRNDTMDRKTNFSCLCSLLETLGQTSDQETRLRVRQAMYIHGIVDAVLSERVDLLPEASFASY